MNLIKKSVGKKIAAARKNAGFKTQANFAEKLSTDTSTVGRWEAGVYLPSEDFWQKIYSLTNTSEKDFVENSQLSEKQTDIKKIMLEALEQDRNTNLQLENSLKEISKLKEEIEQLKKSNEHLLGQKLITTAKLTNENVKSILNQDKHMLMFALDVALDRRIVRDFALSDSQKSLRHQKSNAFDNSSQNHREAHQKKKNKLP